MTFFEWVLGNLWQLILATLALQALVIFLAFKFGNQWSNKSERLQLICPKTGRKFRIIILDVYVEPIDKFNVRLVAECPHCGGQHRDTQLAIKYEGMMIGFAPK